MKYQTIAALSATLATLCVAVQDVSAAIVTIDVRAVSMTVGNITTPIADRKSVTVNDGGSIVNFQVVGQIVNADNDRTNDSITGLATAFISNEGPTALLGNIGSVQRDSAFSLGSIGTSANLDSNIDLEWGRIGGGSTTGLFVPSGTTSISSSVGTGVTEVVLGTFSWTAPSILILNSTTLINSLPWVASSGAFNGRGSYTIRSDGSSYSNRNSTDLVAGTGVLLSGPVIPEPATLGMAVVVAVGLLSRRRRRMA